MSNTNTSNNKQAPVNKKEPNDIRIGQNSRVRNVVRYCNSLLKEKTYKTQLSDSKEVQNNQKLYPKMEVILSLEDFKDKTDGYQNKLDETERQKLYKLFNEQPIRRDRRGGFRGRRGGFRGRRGFGFRVRGGFRPRGRPIRGNRPRGGIRGNRGGIRGNRGSK